MIRTLPKASAILACAILLIGAVGAAPVQAPPAAGVATGQRVGNIVRAAIDTALPAVGPLLDLVWKNPNGQKKGDDDKMKKSELEKTLADATKQLKKDAELKLRDVATVSLELRVIGRFLEPVTKARENLVRMQSRAESSTVDWSEQKTDWGVVKAQLQTVDGIGETDIDFVRDMWLRNALKQIKGVNKDQVIRISAELERQAPDRIRLTSALQDLSLTLNTVTAAVVYELSDLQADMRNVSAWTNGTESKTTEIKLATGLTDTQSEYKGLVDQNLKKLGAQKGRGPS